LTPSPRLILFDIDGTLVWTRGAGCASMQVALQTLFDLTHPELAQRIGDKIAAHAFGGKTDWFTLYELLNDEGFGHDDIARHMPRFTLLIGDSLTRVIQSYDVAPCTGAIELIAQLRERDDVMLGLVTGNVHTTAPIKLAAAGFDPADFPIGAFGNDALERTSLPALALERAKKHYGCEIAPQDVIIVGDTVMDIEAARALDKSQVVAVMTGFGKREEIEAAQPDYLLEDLTTFIARVLESE